MTRANTFEYDAFISHAVEDKLPIANELCARLEKAGLKIWYSGRELRVGDRLTQTIEEGLAKSRFGIVILSPTYVSKMWTLREFYSLLSREKEDYKVILPILYDITPEQLAQKDLTMAELFSLRAEKGMDYLVDVLMREISTLKTEDKRKFKLKVLAGIKSILSALSLMFLLIIGLSKVIGFSLVEPFQKADVYQQVGITHDRLSSSLPPSYSGRITTREFASDKMEGDDLQGYFRSQYHLVTVDGKVQYLKDVEGTFRVKIDSASGGFGEVGKMLLMYPFIVDLADGLSSICGMKDRHDKQKDIGPRKADPGISREKRNTGGKGIAFSTAQLNLGDEGAFGDGDGILQNIQASVWQEEFAYGDDERMQRIAAPPAAGEEE